MLIRIFTISFILLLSACSGSDNKGTSKKTGDEVVKPSPVVEEPESPKTITAADMVLSPLADASNVELVTPILVKSPLTLSTDQLSKISFSITPEEGAPLDGELKLQEGGARFIPKYPLRYNKKYNVFFAMTGDETLPVMQWTFTTQKDPIPFTLEVVSESDGTINAGTSLIVLKSSKDLSDWNFNRSDFTLIDSNNRKISVYASYDYREKLISLSTDSKIKFLSEYKLSINKKLISTTGQELEFDKPFTLKTGGDKTGPKVVSQTPSQGRYSVNLDKQIVIIFSEQLKRETVKSNYFVLKDVTNNIIVESDIEVKNDNLEVTVTPKELMKYSTKYELSISSNITDIIGNPLESYVLKFTTRGDDEGPKVVSTTPEKDARNIDVLPEIIIEFNENIENSELKDGSKAIKLVTEAYNEEYIPAELSIDDNKLIIKPTTKLFYSSTYKVRNRFYIGDIKDKNGNTTYNNAFEISFTTKTYENKIDLGVSIDSFELNKVSNKLYALNRANKKLIIIDLDSDKVESTYDLDERPSRLCIDNDSNRLFITNTNVATISEYTISDFKKVADISWSKDNTVDPFHHYHIECNAEALYVNENNWNGTSLYKISRTPPYTETPIKIVKNIGGMKLSSNEGIFVWGTSWGSTFKRYQLDGDQWSIADQSSKTYPQNEKNGRDSLIFLDEDKNRVINNRYIYNASNLRQTFHEFGENEAIYAADTQNRKAASLFSIYSLDNFSKLDTLPIRDSDGILFDNEGDVYMIDNSESSIFYMPASDIGTE